MAKVGSGRRQPDAVDSVARRGAAEDGPPISAGRDVAVDDPGLRTSLLCP